MSIFSLKNKGKDGFHIIIEILDTSIVSNLVMLGSGNYSIISKIAQKHTITPENGFTEVELKRFTNSIDKAFVALSDNAKKKFGNKKIKIRSVTAVLYYPWFAMHNSENIPLTDGNEQVELTKERIEKTLREVSKKELAAAHPMAEYVYEKSIIESLINSVKLNGYAVADPFGKKSKNITVTASFYTAALSVIDILRKAVKFHTGCEVNLASLPHVYASYAEKMKHDSPLLFLDVENGYTTICSFSKNSPYMYNTEIVPMGFEQVMRRIAEKSGSASEVAHSYMRLSDRGVLSSDASILVDSARNEALSQWREKINSALAKNGVTTEKSIVHCRDLSLLPMFKKMLDHPKKEYTVSDKGGDIQNVVVESSLFGV